MNSLESFCYDTTALLLPLILPKKRWKLLDTIEKCDEDLTALKKIINTVCSISVPDGSVSDRPPSLVQCMNLGLREEYHQRHHGCPIAMATGHHCVRTLINIGRR
ncbi:hypothetical protein SAY87_001359 [Trapa incisa]|uniref:Uncharacterized protein n=1 Tax=Trapa incisa TaxID=236973 RepID=A0AAN7GNF5_9MYRT|nr:hypothetical protein SAY87_001359 [Trapa incisa]